MSLGLRSWGNSATGSSESIVCAYEGRSEVSARLLDALPTVLVLRADEWDTPLIDLLSAEAGRDGPGQEAYLDRLLDLLLIGVLRTWFDRDGNAPPWWQAEQDPVVGPALKLIYNNPAHPWTVANLAAAVDVHVRCSPAGSPSRSANRRSPSSPAGGWRWRPTCLRRQRGHDRRRGPRRSATRTPFALSSAFKRSYGVSPNEHRAV